MTDTSIIDFDLDAADPDILRERIVALREAVAEAKANNNRLVASITVFANLVEYLNEEHNGSIREWAKANPGGVWRITQDADITLADEYEVNLTVPVNITVTVEATDEDDAHHEAIRHLSDEVSISVTGDTDSDWDADDAKIKRVARMTP